MYDVSLGPDTDPNKLLAHRLDCPFVRHQADVLELPVMTMLCCEKPLPDSVRLHDCLEEGFDRPASAA